MKFILASKFYYNRAGLEAYLFKISCLLKSYGHETIPFSTKYNKNIQTEWDKFFTEYINLGGEEKIGLHNKLKAIFRIFYNDEARRNFSNLLDCTKPDVVWGFGVHRHLSPSIFMEAKKRGIPVIHRLSDYAIICPDSRLRKGDNSNCTDVLCPTKGFHHALKNKCVKLSKHYDFDKYPSFSASLIGAMELFLHNSTGAYVKNVSKFIAPSKFLRQIMINAGIPDNKITHIPIFIDANDYRPEYEGLPYFVYFGRLSEEKGLPVLLDAMSRIKEHKLIVVGDGPQRSYLEKIKEEKNLTNVTFLGKMQGEQLHRIVRNSKFVVVPSVWFDNSPNVILEAFAMGKPVLAADIGGIPEYISPEINGLLYEYDNVDKLEEKINYLMNQSNLCSEMGRAARKTAEDLFSPNNHYNSVIKLVKSIT